MIKKSMIFNLIMMKMRILQKLIKILTIMITLLKSKPLRGTEDLLNIALSLPCLFSIKTLKYEKSDEL